MRSNPFRDALSNTIIEDGSKGEPLVSNAIAVRSEGGTTVMLDQLYVEAFALAWEATRDRDGNDGLRLDINSGREPRVFPVTSGESAPLGWALPRILHDAGIGERVCRKDKRQFGDYNWTIIATRRQRGAGKESTRAALLNFVESKAGRSARDAVEERLIVGDTEHRG
jgi:hypothetical protein